MAHFAQIDDDNKVVQVITVSNNDILDENGNESEAKGIEYCKQFIPDGNFVQTSYNHNFRNKYAAIGDTYDSEKDAFIMPKLFENWIFDENKLQYKPPIDAPNDGKSYYWDQDSNAWIAYPTE